MQKSEFARMLNIGLSLVGVQMELREREVNHRLSEFLDESNHPYSHYTIGGWRKGEHQPEELDKIAVHVLRFCKQEDRYDMVTQTWAKRFLKLANYPKPEAILGELFDGSSLQSDVEIKIETTTYSEKLMALMSDAITLQLHKTLQTIKAYLQSTASTQSQSYFSHISRVLEYLHHFTLLLPTDKELNERERSVLLTAAHLFRLSRNFLYQLNMRYDIDLAMDESEFRQITQRSSITYDEFVAWIQDFLKSSEYPSLGWTKTEFATQIATVCQGAFQIELRESASYSASGSGEHLIRPALLAAMLNIADMLASVKSRPELKTLQQPTGHDTKSQVAAWLRFYLQDVKIQDGHIRFHYLLPPQTEYIAVQVLLSLPLQLRLRKLRDILTRHHLMIFADSTVERGNREPMPPLLLQEAQRLANEWLNKYVPTILGTTDAQLAPQLLYPYSGLQNAPHLSWPNLANAERYQCQLYHIDTAQRIAMWETPALESDLETYQITPDEKYEWLIYAYAGKQRLGEQRAGIFWLNNRAISEWFDSQIQHFAALDAMDIKLLRARLYRSNEFYAEASLLYADVVEAGNEHQHLQANQELMMLYEEIAQQLSRYKRFRRADLYRAAATNIARLLAQMISENPVVDFT